MNADVVQADYTIKKLDDASFLSAQQGDDNRNDNGTMLTIFSYFKP